MDQSAERAEDQFFDALRRGDAEQAAELLDEQFAIVDVISGAVADRSAFVAALHDGALEFERVELVERAARRYGDTAVIVGRTQMSGAFAGAPFDVASRYTHVLILGGDGHWRLVTAQGTRIADAESMGR